MLYQSGLAQEARSKAYAFRPAVEATHYKPLLAELLAVIGDMECALRRPRESGSPLSGRACRRRSQWARRSGRHGRIRFVVLRRIRSRATPGRPCLGSDRKRDPRPTRARPFRNSIMVQAGRVCDYLQARELARARVLQEEAVRLKVEALGPEHPDIAGSLVEPRPHAERAGSGRAGDRPP